MDFYLTLAAVLAYILTFSLLLYLAEGMGNRNVDDVDLQYIRVLFTVVFVFCWLFWWTTSDPDAIERIGRLLP